MNISPENAPKKIPSTSATKITLDDLFECSFLASYSEDYQVQTTLALCLELVIGEACDLNCLDLTRLRSQTLSWRDIFPNLDNSDLYHFPWELLQRMENSMGELIQRYHPPCMEKEYEARLSERFEGVHFKNASQIYVAQSAFIEPFATIHGPAWIGPRCNIRQGAYVRGNVVAISDNVLGHCSEIKNSFFFPKAKAAHFAYVGDSLLGSRTNLGAGARLANLRMDKASIKVHLEGRSIDTGRVKLGGILGDDSQVGCNSVLNPGSVLSKAACVWPCISASGSYGPGALIQS